MAVALTYGGPWETIIDCIDWYLSTHATHSRSENTQLWSINNIPLVFIYLLSFSVFGVNLQTAVYRSQLGTDDIELPTVFRECIDLLEENG